MVADLLIIQGHVMPLTVQTAAMNLYCWACQEAHLLPLADVERVVYSLGADLAYSESTPSTMSKFDSIDVTASPCLLDALAWSNDLDIYAEHVEQSISNRAAS